MRPDSLAETHARAFSEVRSWTTDEFASLLADPGVCAFGSAESFVLARFVADEAEVLTLATRPDLRRRGLAREALSRCEAAARACGISEVFLEVAEDNTAARALYEATGYLLLGRRPDYYRRTDGPPAAALMLRKPL